MSLTLSDNAPPPPPPAVDEAPPKAPAVKSRSEVLARFALVGIGLILLAQTITSVSVALAMRRHAIAQAESSAPVLMNMVTGLLQQQTLEDPDALRRLLVDLTRVPHIHGCGFRAANPPEGFPPLINVEVQRADGGLRRLTADVQNPAGELLGSVYVDHGPERAGAVVGMLWTTSGLAAALCLGVFAAAYGRTRRRFQPISFVRDNLLAFHSGAETSLEMLYVHEVVSREASAWNELVTTVSGMQRELERYRCRENVADSLMNLQSHSSQAILSALPIGVLRVDRDDRVVYANYTARRLLHFRNTQTETPALKDEMRHETVAQTVLELRQNVGGTGLDCQLETGSRQNTVRLTPISLGSETDDLVVTIQDITQLKEVERSRDGFLAHITHELRTPLTNIRAYVETLNDDFFDDEQTRRECYNVIMTETRRLSKLIEDVLSVSQIEAGSARLTRVNLRIEDSLRQALQDVQAAADAKSIELSLEIPSKVPMVSGDKHRLHQVWTNVIGNAIKYTPAGGTVDVAVESDEQMLRLLVRDNGPGIAPENHEKVFDKFFRVPDAAVDAEEGTGLGLAIVREIVRLHGGAIRVESKLGAGATFIVELPSMRSGEPSEKAGAADGTHRDR